MADRSQPPEAGEPLYRAKGCFACGTENHVGLELAPHRVGDEVVAHFRPKPAHRGWSRLVHGGILATALDEVVCVAAGQQAGLKVLTVKADVRYTAPAFMNREYTIVGRPLDPAGRYHVAEGEVIDDRGTVVATATLHCLAVDEEKAARFLDRESRDS